MNFIETTQCNEKEEKKTMKKRSKAECDVQNETQKYIYKEKDVVLFFFLFPLKKAFVHLLRFDSPTLPKALNEAPLTSNHPLKKLKYKKREKNTQITGTVSHL